MALSSKIGSIGNIGSIILAILEVQVTCFSFVAHAQNPRSRNLPMLESQEDPSNNFGYFRLLGV